MNRAIDQIEKEAKELRFLSLPLILQESLLPRASGPEILTRNYGETNITLHSGVYRSKRVLLPSGVLARRLLYWLVSQGRYTDSPAIEMPGVPSLMRQLNLSVNARRRRELKTQLIRLVNTGIKVERFKPYDIRSSKGDLISEFSTGCAMFESSYLGWENSEQQELFASKVVFSDQFWETIKERPHHPVNLDALFSLRSPLASDIYIWAHRRTITVNVEQMFKWSVMFKQFARPGEQKSKFRKSFTRAVDEINHVMKTWGTSFAGIRKEGLLLRNCPLQHEDHRKTSESRGYG